MYRAVRWLLYAVAGVAAVAVLAAAFVYVRTQAILERRYPLPADTVPIPTDADSVREGERLARVLTCMGGCHGRDGAGAVLFDQPPIATIVAPNLHEVAHRPDAEVIAAIRHGLGPDGRSLVVMPAEAYRHLSDADLGRVIAYLRSLPPAEGPAKRVVVGPLGRIGLLAGELKITAQRIADSTPSPRPADPALAQGWYVAEVACGHCHSPSLTGWSNPDFTAPSLRIVSAYSDADFTRLLRTGKALGERELKVMSATARISLAHLTDAEIAALYAYLRSPGVFAD